VCTFRGWNTLWSKEVPPALGCSRLPQVNRFDSGNVRKVTSSHPNGALGARAGNGGARVPSDEKDGGVRTSWIDEAADVATVEFERYARTTRRAAFLGEMVPILDKWAGYIRQLRS
jgi:hypothetical protein